jgi:hypothetical protein
MNLRRLSPILVVALLTTAPLIASGPLSLYGIVEKVAFEPNEENAERIQVWGAFMYVNTGMIGGGATTAAKKGYMYFQLPVIVPGGGATEARRTNARREWNDLKSVAGTGQAIGFGGWTYFSEFQYLQPDQRPVGASFIAEFMSPGGAKTDLRVRPASEAPANPAMYLTNTGVVKLTEANHADVIKRLKEALK